MPPPPDQEFEFNGVTYSFPAEATQEQILAFIENARRHPTISQGASPLKAVSEANQQLWGGDPSVKEKEWSHPALRFAGGVLGAIPQAIQGIGSAVLHPIDTAVNAGRAQYDQVTQSNEAAKRGDKWSAFGHRLAAAVPLVGPAAANIGEHIAQSGDIAGGLGQGTALAGSIVAPGMLQGPLSRIRPVAESWWDDAAGNGLPGVAKNVLSRGKGRFTPANTEALKREAIRGTTPATPGTPGTPASTVLNASGQPAIPATSGIPGTPRVPSPLWPSVYAHRAAVENAGRAPTLGGAITRGEIGAATYGITGSKQLGGLATLATHAFSPSSTARIAQAAYRHAPLAQATFPSLARASSMAAMMGSNQPLPDDEELRRQAIRAMLESDR